MYCLLLIHWRVRQVPDTLATGSQWLQTDLFSRLHWSVMQNTCKASEYAASHASLRQFRLTSYIFPPRRMCQSEEQLDRGWSVNGHIRGVFYDAEPTSPLGRRALSTLNGTLTRIQATSWTHSAVPQRNDDLRVFGRYWWCSLQLFVYKVHQTTCVGLGVNALRNRPRNLLISWCLCLNRISNSTYRTVVQRSGTDVAFIVW